MTILHSISSTSSTTVQRTEAFSWPRGTEHTPDDILIGGTSLTAAARGGQTPLVRIGETSVPDASSLVRRAFVTVLVTRVIHVDRLGMLQRPDVWVDADLRVCEPIMEAARIIGRAATDRRRRARMLTETDPATHRDVKLSADIQPGDLIAIPCHGTLPHTHVARHFPNPVVLADKPDDQGGDPGFYGSCGK